MAHSGVDTQPITIEAEARGTAFLDGQRRSSVGLYLTEVSHVIVRGLVVQWARKRGVACYRCSSVEISDITFRNALSGAHNNAGVAVAVSGSQGVWIHHNLIRNWQEGVNIGSSSNTRLTNNTIVGTELTGVTIGPGCLSTTVRYNSINFAGNHALQLLFAAPEASNLDLDFNNYGSTFRPDVQEKVDPQTLITPAYYWLSPLRELMLYSGGSTPVFYSFAAWKSATGYDRHSVFADPMWVDPLNEGFNVEPGSPNLLRSGQYIGACDTSQTCAGPAAR